MRGTEPQQLEITELTSLANESKKVGHCPGRIAAKHIQFSSAFDTENINAKHGHKKSDASQYGKPHAIIIHNSAHRHGQQRHRCSDANATECHIMKRANSNMNIGATGTNRRTSLSQKQMIHIRSSSSFWRLGTKCA